MKVRHKRFLLSAASWLLLTGTVGVVVWGVLVAPQPPTIKEPRVVAKRPLRLPSIPSLDELKAVSKRPLQGRLYDPPPQPKPKPVKPDRQKDRPKKRRRDRISPSAVGLRLVGTVLENGKSMAILQNGKKMEVCAVGQPLKLLDTSLRVESVADKQVTLSRGKSTLTLTLHQAGTQ